MKKEDINILIIEDDASFGAALSEAVSKGGYHSLLATKPDEALNIFKIHEIHLFIIDCMLPQMSGIDLAQELRKRGATNQPFMMMSGIFRDRGFMQDAKQKTGAIDFLEKPFDLDTFLTKLETVFESIIDAPLDPLSELLTKESSTPGERLAAIKSTASIPGRELPYILSLLCHPSISGELVLKDDTGDKSQVFFGKNHITGVHTKDRKSFFGNIMVEKNFVDPEELEIALGKPSTKRIGERLVDENLISPHVIDIVTSEQIGLRLSSLIQDTSYEISFIPTEANVSKSSLSANHLSKFYSDWVNSKFDFNYLQASYLPWMENAISLSPSFKAKTNILTLSPLNRMAPLIEKLKAGGATIATLLDTRSASEEDILASLHLLVLNTMIYFDPFQKKTDYNSLLSRVEKIEKEMENQNYFELIGVSSKARSGEVKKAYHELAKVFHPDKISETAPVELKEKTEKVFAQMTKAYEVLSNAVKREQYEKELSQGQAEKILQSEGLFEEGKAALRSGQYTRAREVLAESIGLRPPPPELTLHHLWACLASIGSAPNKSEEMERIEREIEKIPPEERHSATYYFVKGLLTKNQDQTDQARRSFQQAVSINSNFVEAKRELNLLKYSDHNSDAGKPVDILKGDLKDVVGLLFKKKKKSG